MQPFCNVVTHLLSLLFRKYGYICCPCYSMPVNKKASPGANPPFEICDFLRNGERRLYIPIYCKDFAAPSPHEIKSAAASFLRCRKCRNCWLLLLHLLCCSVRFCIGFGTAFKNKGSAIGSGCNSHSNGNARPHQAGAAVAV